MMGRSKSRSPKPRAHRLRFALERLVLRGLGYRLLLAAALVALVSLVAGALVVVVDPGFSDLGEAVWWAFVRLTDPGYLGDDEGLARRSVSTIVTVLGYLLFLGLLIAILTQWLNDTIEKLESGVTPVAVSDHVLVLGWTHRTPVIVSELLRATARVERFLARHGARELRIVILAEQVNDELTRELRERVGKRWNDRQVLLRSGTPLKVDHLERVAFRNAAALILPGADFAERKPEAIDAQTVKTLMSVSRNASEYGFDPPLAVAGLYDGRGAAVARSAYAGESEIVAVDEIISRIIAQSVRQRGMCSVLSQLFSGHGTNALYVRDVDVEAGFCFHDIAKSYVDAIVLGTVRSGVPRPVLNPDPEMVLVDEDRLVFIARSFADCMPQSTPRAALPPSGRASLAPVFEPRRLLILGWNRKVPALLRELARYGRDAFEIDVVSDIPVDQRQKVLERYTAAAPSDRVRQIEAGFNAPDALERLDPVRYDNIILMASEGHDEQEHADATTVFTYMMLRDLIPKHASRPELFVELLNEENKFLFEKENEDVIVSPLLVSYLLTQISLRRELAAVYDELSRPWGAQIVLHRAQAYLDSNGPIRMEALENAAAERGEIVLGLRRVSGPEAGLTLNPDRNAAWTLSADDEVVVLATCAEPGGDV